MSGTPELYAMTIIKVTDDEACRRFDYQRDLEKDSRP